MKYKTKPEFSVYLQYKLYDRHSHVAFQQYEREAVIDLQFEEKIRQGENKFTSIEIKVTSATTGNVLRWN